MTLNLYLISQDKNDGYDTYSDAVVAAVDETAAKLMHPGGDTWVLIPDEFKDETDKVGIWLDEGIRIEDISDWSSWSDGEWTEPDFVDAKLVGFATNEIKEGVICASYHAG